MADVQPEASPRRTSTWWLALDALLLAAMLFVIQRFVFHRGGQLATQIAIDAAIGVTVFVVLVVRRNRGRSVAPAAQHAPEQEQHQ